MKRPLLLPLVPIYAAGLWAKRRFIEKRPGYTRRLAWPVVSVGSLSAGGAGKTPVVAALADLLERHGFAVDVLSRGYGRGSAAVERVNPDGLAEQYGDEPLVLARAGLRVWVGADRYLAGMMAEAVRDPMSQSRDMGHPISGVGPRVHLLDDGFQHRRLARALDVVLLTAEDARDRLLPAGNLREPLTRLSHAGAVVLREEEAEALRPLVKRLAGDVPLWVVRRRLAVEGLTEPVVAFCGIARPEGFFANLREAGMELAETVAFSDHHRYREKDIDRLLAGARKSGFVTTEKDAVRLTSPMRERLGKVTVAELRVEFLWEDSVLERISGCLAGRTG